LARSTRTPGAITERLVAARRRSIVATERTAVGRKALSGLPAPRLGRMHELMKPESRAIFPHGPSRQTAYRRFSSSLAFVTARARIPEPSTGGRDAFRSYAGMPTASATWPSGGGGKDPKDITTRGVAFAALWRSGWDPKYRIADQRKDRRWPAELMLSNWVGMPALQPTPGLRTSRRFVLRRVSEGLQPLARGYLRRGARSPVYGSWPRSSRRTPERMRSPNLRRCTEDGLPERDDAGPIPARIKTTTARSGTRCSRRQRSLTLPLTFHILNHRGRERTAAEPARPADQQFPQHHPRQPRTFHRRAYLRWRVSTGIHKPEGFACASMAECGFGALALHVPAMGTMP
jgi:hypothetical protein